MNASPTPFYFGPAGAGLFGWLHAAAGESRPGFGLVVCNPFGFEEVCAHRSLRLMASSTAAAGIPTLRFDAAGCGNSEGAEGDELEPDRLSAWVQSVHVAIDALKANTGVSHVCLLGMRLGASVAALAAAQRDDVCGLIAIAPVVRGRDWVRELRMLAPAAPPPGGECTPSGTLESAGFVLAAQTLEALRKLDLCDLPKAPAPEVLIVERDDLPGPRRWQEALLQLGARTRTEAWPGYAAIMTNPQDAKPPQRIIDGVVQTLLGWQSAPGVAPVREPAVTAAGLATSRSAPGSAVCERIVGIPVDDAALFGIVTTPAASCGGRPIGKRLGILMLNSGSVHHIGPNRLWVTLARRWAARGATVLRIDLTGIGDSPAHAGAPENRVYSAEAARDIVAALAWLRREGIEDCRLLGLCSGAFHALNAAVAGANVSAAFMINPLTYSWEDCNRLGTALNEHEILLLSKRYRRQLFSTSTWRRLLRRELDLKLIVGVVARRARELARSCWAKGRRSLGITEESALGNALAAAATRGVRLNFIFGEGASGHELMRHQIGEPLGRLLSRAQIAIDVVPQSDHTFTRLDARARLTHLLDTRMFTAGDPARAESPAPLKTMVAARPRQSANDTAVARPSAASPRARSLLR